MNLYNLKRRADVKPIILAQPTKLLYKIGETFDPTGLKLSISYNGKTKEITDFSDLSFESYVANGQFKERIVVNEIIDGVDV